MVAAVAASALEERFPSRTVGKKGSISDTLLESPLEFSAVVARLGGHFSCCVDNSSLRLIRLFDFLDDRVVCAIVFELAWTNGNEVFVLSSKRWSLHWISPLIISIVVKFFEDFGVVSHASFDLGKAYCLNNFVAAVVQAWDAHGGCLDVRKHFELTEPKLDEEMTIWR